MQVSVEISLYPLQESYIKPITQFIERLETHSDLIMSHGIMSSTILGDYQQIMAILTTEMEQSLKAIPESVFIIKLSGGCR
ncbi:MAG: YkoF family thiamine/hydroxymethylpyrimidine-binding protein [Thiomicrorhabdus chilensis]|uniref:YkoF family thiamine/hydroxymethylpyrimidine-binding protein n=1 Tax=Thiomicrorhabdus chilensis TaxID=63656 RepID=UPI00299DC79A|nr:YkoF family thiamine/hydroxymethylpyrimidine-binding protein [Thiomicrorhabdus chilensis]MDX1346773.1 YkoF family thiamine/hydroxymethylpyrimidine-binding protein [Thiomicrorhabdus chilensis]